MIIGVLAVAGVVGVGGWLGHHLFRVNQRLNTLEKK
jgi:hypothetical protein